MPISFANFRIPLRYLPKAPLPTLNSRPISSLPASAPLNQLRAAFRPLGSGKVTLDLGYKPGIARILVSNVAKRNALSPSMMADLADAVDVLEAVVNGEGMAGTIGEEGEDDDEPVPIVAVILEGDGGTFCSGFDLSVARESFLTPISGSHMSRLMHSSLTRLRRLPLVSVAAVDGHAIGGGAELAVSCDFRAMSEKATLRFLQVKMGVTPGWAGATHLTQILPRPLALQILCTSPTLTSDYCASIHLANAIAKPSEPAITAAERFLAPFIFDTDGTRKPFQAVRGMKRVVSAATDGIGADQALEVEKRVFEGVWGSPANLRAIERAKVKRK
ncbi:enoyl CoA hydratase domain-containing protein 1 [Borealophlyctis nickersoniae]|nr:enoyl CoA hydratase domain-containing protein 1 [Borealophlyctis nickersoniae]